MLKRLVVGLVALSCVAVGAGYASAFAPGGAPAWAPWCLALGSNGALTSLMALGAMRRGRIAPALGWTFAGTFVLCAGSFVVALALPANEGPQGPLLFGLPLRSAIVLLGVGVAPIAILPLAYALTFDRSTLSDDDLRRVREAYQTLRRERGEIVDYTENPKLTARLGQLVCPI